MLRIRFLSWTPLTFILFFAAVPACAQFDRLVQAIGGAIDSSSTGNERTWTGQLKCPGVYQVIRKADLSCHRISPDLTWLQFVQ